MINNKFGLVFRELRKKKGWTLSDFSEVAISQSALSRFEKGENSLDVDKFFAGLRLLDVSCAEFEQTYLGLTRGDFKSSYDALYEAYFSRDIAKVKAIQEAIKNPLQRLALKCLILDLEGIGTLRDEEEEELVDYFEKIEHWGIFEMSMLQFTIAQLKSRDVINVLEQFHKDTQGYTSICQYRRYLVSITNKGAFTLIFHERLMAAKRVLQSAWNFTKPDDLCLRNEINFAKAYYSFKLGDKSKGLDEADRVIKIFEYFKNKAEADYFTHLKETYLIER